ncbi:MAG: hypothetical protein Kow00108_02230 [Calditrichia bacterium]
MPSNLLISPIKLAHTVGRMCIINYIYKQKITDNLPESYFNTLKIKFDRDAGSTNVP